MLIRELNTFVEGDIHRNISITEASQLLLMVHPRRLIKTGDKGGIAKRGRAMDYGQDAFPGAMEWLIQFGDRVEKVERKDMRVLPNGRGQALLEYPSLPDMLAFFEHFDALRAMARLHQPDRVRPLAEPLSKRLPRRRLDV